MIWYAIDLETATNTRGSICEVAAVEFSGCDPTGKYYQKMIQPPHNIYDPEVQQYYDESHTEDAAPWVDVAEGFGGFIGDAPMVAHLSDFDFAHLYAQHLLNGSWYPQRGMFCSLRLARRVLPDLSSHKLETLVEHLNLSIYGTLHTAFSDAVACGQVWVRCAAEDNKTPSEAMRDQAQAGRYVGSLEWLRHRRDCSEPVHSTGPQVKFIIDLWAQIISWDNNSSDILSQLGGVDFPADPPEGWDVWVENWAAGMTKNQASKVISYLLQQQSAPDALRSSVASEIRKQVLVENEQSVTETGLWLLSVAGCGPLILEQPATAGKEAAEFLARAGKKHLQQLLGELRKRPI